ncbi:hypothetical protein EXIGLDRAFT_724096 [Exidia glandulosa HHB12029]|uniref:Uncharacterized protein n=1 Tax=Exidia glandulosa HHB12029 TaxID=1314781 RepID=A0A165EJJ0_EXIGL|nr:hypothetical protein EXIGLDRAFT_724096 [Exidia glandulosa HHB12029]
MVLDRDGNEDDDGVFDSEVCDENDWDDEDAVVNVLLVTEPDDSIDDAELNERVVDGKPLMAVVDDAVVNGVVDIENAHDSEDDADAVDTAEAESDTEASREFVVSVVDMETPLPSASVTSAGAMLASSMLGVPAGEPRCEVLVTCLRRIAPAGSCP